MYLKIFYALLSVLLSSVLTDSITSAQQDAAVKHERLQEELDQIQEEQKQAVDKWRQSGQEYYPSLQSPLVSSEYLSQRLPAECIDHLEEEKAKLQQGGYSKAAWLHHVFECEKCCAPLFVEVMDMHVLHVIASPHMVVLFDFDTDTMKQNYQQRLDAFMHHFDAQHDQLLLIGRASRIGSRPYNIALSGRRAGKLKDYILDKLTVNNDRIRYLFFGADSPQLTLENAADYGITAEEIAAIDVNLRNRAENKINQSVVVIINKDSDDTAEPHTTPQPMAQEYRPEARESTQAKAVSENTKDSPAKTTSVPDADKPSGKDREETVPPHLRDSMIMVTEALTSTSFRFGLDVIKVGRDTELNIILQQSKGGMDTIERLRGSEQAAVGMVQSDMPGIMSRLPDAEMNRLAEQLHLLFPLYHEEVHLFARNDIQRVEALNGKRVIVGMKNTRTWLTAHHLLHKLKVKPGELIDTMMPLKAILAVLQGTADAMFYVGGKPAWPFIQLRNVLGEERYASILQEANFVPLNSGQAGQDYLDSTLGPQDYPWAKTSVPTVAVQVVLASFDAARPDSQQDDRYCGQLVTLSQAVRDNFAALQRSGHPAWQEVDLDNRLPAWKYHSCTPPQAAQ